MTRLLLIVLGSCTFLATLAQGKDCMNAYGSKRCLTKAEVGGFSVFMKDGDPCFTYSGNRWCFVTNQGNMEPCTCSTECGCGAGGSEGPAAPEAPTCDSSSVPTDFDVRCGNGYKQGNTMCMFTGIGSGCNGKVCLRELTQEQKDAILDKHNQLRRKVAKGEQEGQPGASNMSQLTWNDELATTAQRWTDQCQGGHDKDRTLPGMSPVGQNFASTGSSANSGETDMNRFVQMWYDEVKDFDSSTVSAYTSAKPPQTGVVGHYTQVVWAKTQQVGCGFIQFYKDGFYMKNLVCNYYPAGNFLGEPLYQVGTAGADCEGSSNDGLCV